MAGMRAVLIASLVVPFLAAGVWADPQSDYDMLFGEAEKKVLRTASEKDDAALAAKLLESADTVTDSPDLQLVLYEKAFDLGITSALGHETGIAALRLLEEKAPERKTDWRRKLMEAYRVRHAAASGEQKYQLAPELMALTVAFAQDARRKGNSLEAMKLYRESLALVPPGDTILAKEIQAAVRAVTAVQRVERKLRLLTDRMKIDPSDVASRRGAVICHVTGRDRPQDAVGLLNKDLDEDLRTYVPLAVKKIDDLAGPVCLEVAGWYRSLAAKGSSYDKAVSLTRAQSYYQQYLQVHAKQDVARLKAKVALDETNAALKKLPPLGLDIRIRPVKLIFADKAVQKAYDNGVKYLLARQQKDGSWPSNQNRRYPAGASAMITFTLLETGLRAGNPAMIRALDWLGKRKTTKTYTLAWRSRAYLAASRTRKGYLSALSRDVRQLVASSRDGSFRYDSRGKPEARDGDRSNSQYGLYGIAAGHAGRVRAPKSYWQAAEKFWRTAQRSDGGWGYTSRNRNATATMTAAGIVSSMISYTRASAGKVNREEALLKYKPVKAGLAWLDRAFAGTMNTRRRRWAPNHYYFFAVSRVALVTGRKQFGGIDWFKTASGQLVQTQAGNGAWKGRYGDEISTAFAILTLINGYRAQNN